MDQWSAGRSVRPSRDTSRSTRRCACRQTVGCPEFSPDGRWLAYASDKTGRFEVYLRPYPAFGPSTPVSIAGGSDPAWNPKGGELFFLEPVPSAPGDTA